MQHTHAQSIPVRTIRTAIQAFLCLNAYRVLKDSIVSEDVQIAMSVCLFSLDSRVTEEWSDT